MNRGCRPVWQFPTALNAGKGQAPNLDDVNVMVTGATGSFNAGAKCLADIDRFATPSPPAPSQPPTIHTRPALLLAVTMQWTYSHTREIGKAMHKDEGSCMCCLLTLLSQSSDTQAAVHCVCVLSCMVGIATFVHVLCVLAQAPTQVQIHSARGCRVLRQTFIGIALLRHACKERTVLLAIESMLEI